MSPEHAARWLVLSGGAAVLFSSLLGVGMLVPMQRAGASRHGGRSRALLAAHLDWILLGLMEGLAAGLVMLFEIHPPSWCVVALVSGAWINPLPYVFRAFGVDAFRFAGGFVQRLAAMFGAASSGAILVGWTLLLVRAIARP